MWQTNTNGFKRNEISSISLASSLSLSDKHFGLSFSLKNCKMFVIQNISYIVQRDNVKFVNNASRWGRYAKRTLTHRKLASHSFVTHSQRSEEQKWRRWVAQSSQWEHFITLFIYQFATTRPFLPPSFLTHQISHTHLSNSLLVRVRFARNHAIGFATGVRGRACPELHQWRLLHPRKPNPSPCCSFAWGTFVGAPPPKGFSEIWSIRGDLIPNSPLILPAPLIITRFLSLIVVWLLNSSCHVQAWVFICYLIVFWGHILRILFDDPLKRGDTDWSWIIVK